MRLRIPVIDQPSVQSRPAAGAVAPFAQQANTEIGDAAARLGQSLGQTADRIQRRIEQAKARADALMVAQADAADEAATNGDLVGESLPDGTRRPGYLETQGLAASEVSFDVLTNAKKRQAQLGQGLANDEQREAFEQRAAQRRNSLSRTVETHASQQRRVAEKATAEALQTETLKAVVNSPDDLATPIRSAAVEGSIRALALSPEDAEADVSRWRAKLAGAQIDRELAQGDITAAEKLLEEKHDDLGVLRDEATFKIQRKKEVGRIQREQAENETTVTAIIGESRRPDKTIDKARAAELLEKVPPERYTEVRRLLESRERLYDQVEREQTKDRRLRARAQFIAGGLGAIDPDTARDLKASDGDYYARLQREQDIISRRARAGTKGKAEQKTADRVALWQFKAELIDDPNADAEEWSTGMAVGPETLAHMKVLQAQEQKKASRAETTGRRRFVADLERVVPEIRGKGKKAPVWGAEQRSVLRGQAVEAYDAFKAKHPDQEPTAEDVSRTAIELSTPVEIPGSGYDVPLIGTVGAKKEPAFMAADRAKKAGEAPPSSLPAPSPSGKPAKVLVRRKSDGKKGLVFSDKVDLSKYDLVSP